MSMPRPLTDAECALLMHRRPQTRDYGELGAWRYWIVRYDGFPDPLVSVWTPEPGMVTHHVWFAGATLSSVRGWVASLGEPVRAQLRRRAA
jgi:hypothetical protein